jgi:hypothetical protein
MPPKWIEPLAYTEAVRAFTVAVTAAHVGPDDEVRVPLPGRQARIDWEESETSAASSSSTRMAQSGHCSCPWCRPS